MQRRGPEAARTGSSPTPRDGVLGYRRRWGKLLHVLFWTALLYGLTVLVARLAEWGSGR